jgi:1-aminocyclopropane-1-carboxylate deaminase/D-cysteine desulfhydrase-like pyridoxal-dependent ACC family enzyme
MDVNQASIYLGTGSTGTHSGILAGITAVGASVTVQGISVSRTWSEQVENIRTLTDGTLKYLGLAMSLDERRVRVDERYRGPGYGQPTPQTMDAIEIAALDEGLILDPVYTGKAMAGLIGHAREGRFQAGDSVVFLHTGGTPALFAYHREMVEALETAAC